MGVLKYKLIHDLWINRGRTLQVVLIITMGAASIGMILGTRNLIIPAMQDNWQSMNPAMLNLFIFPPISEDEVYVLDNIDGVEQIEAFSYATIEWRLSSQDDWQPAGLTARVDYENQGLNKVELTEGDWPTGKEMLVELGSDSFFGIPTDGEVFLRVDDREIKVQLAGTAYYQLSTPAYFGGTPQFYTTQTNYEKLVGNLDYNRVLVSASRFDEDMLTNLADRITDKLEKQGKESGRMITDPKEHFYQSTLDGVFFMLSVLSFLALFLGLLLVYNTVNAIISQQVDQIGVMKAIGANTWQVLRYYLANIMVYGLIALVIALPIGIYGAWGITKWMVSGFGADPGEFAFSRETVIIQVLIALLAPLVASLIPVLKGARITVREAITTYGLATKPGLLERLLARAKRISRLLLITISNTFRKKWRVVLMQLSLVLSGLIFMMVFITRDSLLFTFRDVLFDILNANVTFALENPERTDRVEALTLAYPEVKAVEMWANESGKIRPMGQPATDDDEDISLFGVPLPTQLYNYRLLAGRWLEPDDGYAIVLNKVVANEIGVGVGEWVTIKHGDKDEQDWMVVGLSFDPIFTDAGQVSREVILRDRGEVGKASSIWIQTHKEGLENEQKIAKDLRTYYEQHQVDVSPQRGVFGLGESKTEVVNALTSTYEYVIILLAIMAVIIGSVGAIALSGALSLSVLERRREIGVMRAIGASSWAVARMFIGEGLILGWLSWLISLPLSIPAGSVMVSALGENFGLPLLLKTTPVGSILWFVIVTVLAVFASWIPARSAIRISVRESLAYL